MSQQAGCFSGLFRWKPSRASTSHEQYTTSGSSERAAGGPVLDIKNDEEEKHDHVLAGCIHYASSCDFSVKNGAGPQWLLQGDESEVPLPLYSELNESGRDDIFRPEVMKTIEERIDELSPELRKLSLQIHDHPEIMFQEKYAHDTLTAFMSSHGFTVTKHFCSLPTAWRAEYTYKTGGRTLGINSEMDALPEIGHACGHNLIAISGVGVALAVKTALEKHDVPGRVVLLGTPAEEGGAGKVIMIEEGGYKGLDACIMCHPGPGPAHSVGLGSSLAVQNIEVEYFGHTAHASAAPWEGTNALDAAFLAYSSISVLRQQIKPTHRVHGVIKGKDLAANVIPDYTKMLWLVRAPTWAELEILRERVKACLEAASLATSCKIAMSFGRGTYDLRQNSVLASSFGDTIKARYGWSTTDAEGAIGGSTDFGNVTYEMPAIHPSFAIPTEQNGGNHTRGFTAAARTITAHEICLTVTKSLALTGFRVINDDTFFHGAKQAFENS